MVEIVVAFNVKKMMSKYNEKVRPDARNSGRSGSRRGNLVAGKASRETALGHERGAFLGRSLLVNIARRGALLGFLALLLAGAAARTRAIFLFLLLFLGLLHFFSLFG